MRKPKSSDTSTTASIFTPAVAELVAIAAAIGADCEPIFKHHYSQAQKLGVSSDDITKAVELANAVKPVPSQSMLLLADKLRDMLIFADKHLGTNRSTEMPLDTNPGSCESSKVAKESTQASRKKYDQ